MSVGDAGTHRLTFLDFYPCPPSSIEPCLIVLALFLSVMAGLAKALQVGFIPEHALIATMWLYVVANKLRRVRFNTFAHLTGEQVTHEYLHAKLLPSAPTEILPFIQGKTIPSNNFRAVRNVPAPTTLFS